VKKQETFFPGARFPAKVIDAASALLERLRAQPSNSRPASLKFDDMTVASGHSVYTFDELADWMHAYSDGPRAATLRMAVPSLSGSSYPDQIVLELSFRDESGFDGTSVAVTAAERSTIESVLEMFTATTGTPSPSASRNAEAMAAPIIFIGHGRDPSWRELKDHLSYQQGLTVQAYETGARAGHSIRDILEGLLSSSAFAIFVLAAEDEMADETLRARQNVVHEIGLFQGRLGWHRALLLVETDTDLFSNIDGIQEIRYPKGHIRETYGDVLATLRREFGISVSRN
jgi:predicted nucleotide-binding protein